MTVEIKIPDIGTDKVDVIEILVKPGDSVTVEQSLLTVEGDKASMEIPSPQAGVVREIKLKVGDKVSTGSLAMLFDAPADAVASDQQPQQAAAKSASVASSTNNSGKAAEKEVLLPDIGDDEVIVTEVMVKVGDKIVEEQSLLTIEGDKASMEVPSAYAGVVKSIIVAVGDKVKTGSPVMVFTVEDELESPATVSPATATATVATDIVMPATSAMALTSSAPTAASSAESSFKENEAYVHATPVIRRLAREFGVDLSQVKGTGRKGRILREDVQNYVKQALQNSAASSGESLPGMLPWPKVDFSKFGVIEEVELGRIQKISGANLHRNWVMIPHITQFDEVDITDLEAFRKQQNAEAEKSKLDVKITPLVFMMKAVAKALEVFPRFNSSLSEDGQRLTLKKYINIGVAVDTPNGLLVPVFRDVNSKGIIELSRELSEISAKARAGKLMASEMQGGCFSISSLGGIGGTAFTPIVNAPEVAILGVSRSSIKPVWSGKEFMPRLMLPLSLSYDHRVIDGAEGARFITYLGQIMVDIRRLIM